jgi:hypothetical protein
MQRMFDLLCTHQADVILNGHNHDYEQRAPVDTYSEFDPKGRRQFVMGAGKHPFTSSRKTSIRKSG